MITDPFAQWEAEEAARRIADADRTEGARKERRAAEFARQEAGIARDIAAGLRDADGAPVDDDDADEEVES